MFLVVFWGLFVLIASLEALLPRRSSPQRRKERWGANLGLTALNFAMGLAFPVSLWTAALWAQHHHFGLLRAIDLPLWLMIAIGLPLRAAISFLFHFIQHKSPLLWRFHRVHHLDRELDVTTTIRFHPFEYILLIMVGSPLIILLGLPVEVLALFGIIESPVTLFSHANVRVPRRVERVLRLFIATPDFHRIHHSSWQPETDSNYSGVFPLLDRLFGTYRDAPRTPQEAMELGLAEHRGPRTDSLWWLLTGALTNSTPEGSSYRRSPPAVDAASSPSRNASQSATTLPDV
jgi:sterol desaturase/sphingolipid hydroxylase (fatty acid hydroxylase superfamily)